MIYTKQNKNKYLRNDIFNTQVISVKILLFRMIINKSYYAIHSTMQYEVLPHHNKDGPHHNKDGLYPS